MKNNIALLISLFIALGCMSACKNCKESPPEPPPTINCTGGYVPMNDSCICPEGYYEGYGTCKELRPNEFWGIGYDCACNDTVSMWFNEGMNAGEMHIKFTGRGPGVKRNSANSTWSARYFDLPDGDSVAINMGFLTPCDLDSSSDILFAEPSATGKFTHPDTLKMTLYWHHVHTPFPVLDTCHIVFHR